VVAPLAFTSATPADATFSATGALVHNAGVTVALNGTAGRVPLEITGPILGDDSGLTFSGTGATFVLVSNMFSGPIGGTGATPAAGTFSSVTDSALTSGQVVLAGTAGLLKGDTGLTFSGTGATFALATGGAFLGPAGSTSNVAFGLSTAVNTGFYFPSVSAVGLHLAGQGPVEWINFGGLLRFSSGTYLAWSSGDSASTGADTSQARLGAGLLGIGTGSGGFAGSLKLTTLSINAAGASLGSVNSADMLTKAVTGIQDNTATATFTVTIPNAAHSGGIKVILTGSMGAGNLGANESTQGVEYDIDITRIAGANAVAAIGAAIGLPGAATVAGGDNVSVTAALSAISGAVGATNTFTINVTIAKVGVHNQNNHTCLCYALMMNANSSGITIS